MDFGKRLKAIRLSKELSQRELGEKLGVRQQTIAQYERSTVSPKSETIFRLAKALDIPAFELMDEDIRSLAHKIKKMEKEQEEIFEPKIIDEEYILSLLDQLNCYGLSRIYGHLEDLLKIPEYRKEDDKE